MTIQTTFIASASFGLVQEPFWARAEILKAVTFSFMAAMFAFVYWAVPNRRIAVWHAACGGLLAALGFALMQRLFDLYVVKCPTYAVIYGAFAAIPIFLLWLYLSWAVILVGALVGGGGTSRQACEPARRKPLAPAQAAQDGQFRTTPLAGALRRRRSLGRQFTATRRRLKPHEIELLTGRF